MTKKPFILLICALMLASCDNNPKIKPLEGEAKAVKADKSDMLLGYDLDKDGIREDIEEYIRTLSITDEQKAASRFEAKVLQSVLVVDTEDPDALKKSNKSMMAAINCMNSRFDDYEDADAIGVSLEDRTFNTSTRAAAYKKYNKAQEAAELVIEIPTGDSCETV